MLVAMTDRILYLTGLVAFLLCVWSCGERWAQDEVDVDTVVRQSLDLCAFVDSVSQIYGLVLSSDSGLTYTRDYAVGMEPNYVAYYGDFAQQKYLPSADRFAGSSMTVHSYGDLVSSVTLVVDSAEWGMIPGGLSGLHGSTRSGVNMGSSLWSLFDRANDTEFPLGMVTTMFRGVRWIGYSEAVGDRLLIILSPDISATKWQISERENIDFDSIEGAIIEAEDLYPHMYTGSRDTCIDGNVLYRDSSDSDILYPYPYGPDSRFMYRIVFPPNQEEIFYMWRKATLPLHDECRPSIHAILVGWSAELHDSSSGYRVNAFYAVSGDVWYCDHEPCTYPPESTQ